MKRKIEEELIKWKEQKGRKPLLIKGARQVGKTYLIRKFGKEHFKNTAYINLEIDLKAASYFNDDISPKHLIKYLETTVNERIIPGETLLILDEIQSCERALTSLKYFCEDMPELHVIGAGSLLGVAINRQHFSFPVGKVRSMILYPFDFEEYLWAINKEFFAEEIRRAYESGEPLPDALHNELIEIYKEYLIVGGMPSVIDAFISTESFIDVALIQHEIIDNYIADMSKYASVSDSVKIRACYDSIPDQLGKDNKKFQYKVVQKGGSSTMFGASIEWLLQSGVVLKCHRLEQAIEPLAAYDDLSAFKLYMSDVGLLTMKSKMSAQTILSGEGNIFMGALTENYVAEQLAAKNYPIYYWESKSIAELDFVLQKENKIIGIEVKKGEHVRSKSLRVFMDKYDPDHSIRLSLKNFGKDDKIIYIPLYAAFCI